VTGAGFVVLARRLSLREFGLFSALYGASVAFGGLVDFGSSSRVTRDLAQGVGIGSFHSWLWRRTTIQFIGVTAFSLAALVLLSGKLPAASIILLSLQALALTFAGGCLAAVRALVSVGRATWFVVFGNVLFLVSVVASPARVVLVFASAGATASWLVSAAFALRSIRNVMTPSTDSKQANPWIGAWGFGVIGLAAAAQGLDVAILSAVAGSEEAGRYAAVSKWVQPIILIAYAFGMQSFPALAKAGSHAAATAVIRAGRNALLAAVAVAVLLASLAPVLTTTLLGSRYQSSIGLLRLLSIACIPVVLCQPLIAFLQARGRERWAGGALAGASAAILLAIAILGKHIGASAVAATRAVGFSLLLVLLFREVRRMGKGAVQGSGQAKEVPLELPFSGQHRAADPI
jgi:O-antigen/teichoic acid export membrane protein